MLFIQWMARCVGIPFPDNRAILICCFYQVASIDSVVFSKITLELPREETLGTSLGLDARVVKGSDSSSDRL